MASIDSSKVMTLQKLAEQILAIGKKHPEAFDAGVFMWGDEEGNQVYALHSIKFDDGAITLYPGEELDFAEDDAEAYRLAMIEYGWANPDGTPTAKAIARDLARKG
jgi:hypothetical protein